MSQQVLHARTIFLCIKPRPWILLFLSNYWQVFLLYYILLFSGELAWILNVKSVSRCTLFHSL